MIVGVVAGISWACAPTYISVFSDDSSADSEPPPLVIGLGGNSGSEPPEGTGGEPTATSFTLDDFEDENVKANDPAGWWYPVGDGTGTQELKVVTTDLAPAPQAAEGHLLQISARDFQDWGSAWGVDIAEFVSTGSALELSFSIAGDHGVEVALHALDGSGDHFTKAIPVTPTWSRVVVRIDQLFLVDSSGVRSFDVSTATELQWFLFDGSATTIWIDDVILRSF